MKSKKQQIGEFVIPDGITIEVSNHILTVKGERGELIRKISFPGIVVEKLNDKIIIFSIKKFTKREKMITGTLKAHIKNMVKGVTEGFDYKLKICSGHFPMTVSANGNIIEIKNFLGERKTRTSKILEGVDVDISGDIIKLFGIDKEKVGQTAANLEQATRITNKDKRVFNDRINIIIKDGRSLS